MSAEYITAINSFAIGAMPEINGITGSVRIDFSIWDDEFIGAAYITGKLNGKVVRCIGPNANGLKVPMRSGGLVPTDRRLEN